MKYKKTLLTIFLIACVLISISSVVASDANETIAIDGRIEETNDDIISADEEPLSSDQKESEVLKSDDMGNFTELQSLVDSSPNTLELNRSYINKGAESAVKINKEMTIDGKGHTIDGNHFSRIFTIQSNKIVLKNIVFKNGNQGAIDFYSYSGSLTVSNCTFINNTNRAMGAAIQCSLSANATVRNCTFIKNTAKTSSGDGGAIYFARGGCVINCTFKDNKAEYKGGAIYFNLDEGSCSVVNCTFTNNTAKYGGGAIEFNHKDVYVANSTFKDNWAYYDGGAMSFMYGGTVENCTFINNWVDNEDGGLHGGAIYWDSSDKGNVYNSRFIDCYSAESSAIYKGKGVYNSTFIACRSSPVVSTSYVYNCTFINSTVLQSKVVSDASEVVRCTFIGNFDSGLTVTANDIYGGNPQTITVSINRLATGNISVFVNKVKQPISMNNGYGKVVLNNLADGPYEVIVNFAGDGSYGAKTVTKTFNVIHNESNDKPATPETKVNTPEVEPAISASNLNTVYTSSSAFKVTVYGKDGKPASGVPVVIKVNGKTVATINTADGVAAYKPSQTPGTYKISAEALGKTVTKTLTVKHLVTLKSVRVKKSAKKLVIQASLAKVDGKYLKSKKITFKFNGKKYTAKTDAKGVAKVTVKSAVLKKLKVGKKVTYQATYLKDSVKKTVKVKK